MLKISLALLSLASSVHAPHAVRAPAPRRTSVRAIVRSQPERTAGSKTIRVDRLKTPATLSVTEPPVMLGAFAKYANRTSAQSVQSLETQLGVKLRIDSHYYDWADPFPTPAEKADAAAGRIPMITWWGTSYRSIIDGSQDALIRARVASVKSFGNPVFIRWAAEMNGNWYPWSGPLNNNSTSSFILAWRHIHDIFTSLGANNVVWVWSPNADSHPGGTHVSSWNNWADYYPGDAYVDWVGIDGYNWGGSDGWDSFGSIFSPVYNTYATRKPIMIAETGSVEGMTAEKAAWISAAQTWTETHPDVKALVYFDTNQSSSGIDWRLGSSSSSLTAFKQLAQSPWFGGKHLSTPVALPSVAALKGLL